MNSLFNQDVVVYSCDSSSLVMASGVLYPMDNFPALWTKIEELIRSNRLKMSEPVYDEAMRGEVLRIWCREQELKPFLLSRVDESIQTALRDIQADYQNLAHLHTSKSSADPWVIALAMQYQQGVVITEEQPAGNLQGPKIPDVCKDLGIECINIAGLVTKENWVF